LHELAVTESLLELVERHGRQAGARRVSGIHLVLGQLSTIVDESVQFYWDLVSLGSIAEGARLHFRRVPARLRCRACAAEYHVAEDRLACPACGGTEIQVVEGEEFHLEAIDVEDAADPGDCGAAARSAPASLRAGPASGEHS